MRPLELRASALLLGLAACGGNTSRSDSGADASAPPYDATPGEAGTMPPAACRASTRGAAVAQAPTLQRTLVDRYHESWLASPAVADLDGDGRMEVVLARAGRVLTFGPDGALRWSYDVPGGGRIWASPVVADLDGDGRPELAFAARDSVYVLDARGMPVAGWPYRWRDELRALAAGDLDNDGHPELVVVTTNPLAGSNQRDILLALRGNGTVLSGFPPNTTGTAGCTTTCYVTGGYDQTLALGPLGDDDRWGILAAQDNAYLSWHRGTGVAFDAASIFRGRNKVLGVRMMLDYALAQQGYANNEATDLQAHFTNTAPALADVDGDGHNELVLVSSVQNAAQDNRLQGVALWVLRPDGTRAGPWVQPFRAPGYLAGLWDFDGVNIVALTNQVTVADLDPRSPGPELLFAGFDGLVHCVGADRVERWSYRYTSATDVLTAGLTVADLSGDGVPEVLFATYSTRTSASGLYVLGADGALQQRVDLPGHGAMSVPTIADTDGDHQLEVVVNLKDGEDRVRSGLVFTVPGSSDNCLLWPTGRGNLLRNGYVPAR